MTKRKRSEAPQEGSLTQKRKKSNDKGNSKLTIKSKAVVAKKSNDTEPRTEKQLDNSWSKSKKKRMRRNKSKPMSTEGEKLKINPPSKKQRKIHKSDKSTPASAKQHSLPSAPDDDNEATTITQSTSCINKPLNSKIQGFMERLKGSRFRELNEELYTTTSSSSLERFSKNPDLYQQYHNGFRHQVEQWPVNPVDVMVQWLTKKYQTSRQPIVIADFGCGDAALAKELLQVRYQGKCPFQVHSFDLVSTCDLVTACDMSHTPLLDQSVDVGIFCLSLMGTNLADFIREAHRVLKPKGVLKIAEVRSRFANPTNKKDDELSEFTQVLEQLGFTCRQTDRSNKMFVVLELEKIDKTPNPKVTYTAKPCLYKRR